MVCSQLRSHSACAKLISSLYVYNKIDSVSLDFLDKLAREPNTVVMSCELDLGIQDVVERCWQELQLMRIYTKRQALPIYPPWSTKLTNQQKRGRTRLQRGSDSSESLEHRRSVRSSASDTERDFQIRHGLGSERKACAPEGRIGSCCCG